jgi:ATP-dependent protease ClpP protease subunit
MSKGTEPSLSNQIIEGLMRRRTVVLNGEINYESARTLGQQMLVLQNQSSEPIKLLIDSCGGSIFQALQICDAMTTLMTAPVTGVAFGSCGSAATLIMLHCKERQSTRNSRFLIHSGNISQVSFTVNHTTRANLEQLMNEAKAVDAKMMSVYESYLTPTNWPTEKTPEEKQNFVRELIKRGDQKFDNWMSAEEAIQCGLITTIIEKLDIFE